jgi:hypothetical protein
MRLGQGAGISLSHLRAVDNPSAELYQLSMDSVSETFFLLAATQPHHGIIIIRRRTRVEELFRLLDRAGEIGLRNNVNPKRGRRFGIPDLDW